MICEIIARIETATYVRLPRSISEVIDGGCSCPYCKAHPEEPPRWDTLVIPVPDSDPLGLQKDYAWTCHMPDPKEFKDSMSRRKR